MAKERTEDLMSRTQMGHTLKDMQSAQGMDGSTTDRQMIHTKACIDGHYIQN